MLWAIRPTRAIGLAVILFLAVTCVPSAAAQGGCVAFYAPPGPESGNFITGVWFAEGAVLLGRESLYVRIYIQDSGGYGLGKKGNTYKGSEWALYDFGSGNTFRTSISYVVEHNNDPAKFTMNAVETIIQGSGTGRFSGATGTITDHGPFGITDWTTMDGWATFTSHGSICGVHPAA